MPEVHLGPEAADEDRQHRRPRARHDVRGLRGVSCCAGHDRGNRRTRRRLLQDRGNVAGRLAPGFVCTTARVRTFPKTVASSPRCGAQPSVTVDARTGTLLVVCTDATFAAVSRLLDELDIDGGEGRETLHVIELAHVDAEEVAAALANLGNGAQPTSDRGKAAVAGASISGAVKVTAHTATQTLIVAATALDFTALQKVIRRIDPPRQQLYLEVHLLEVRTQLGRDIDVGAHFGSEAAGGVGYASSKPGSASAISPGVLDGLAAGLIGPTLPTTLFGFDADIPAFGVTLQALETQEDIDIVAQPHLYAAENEQAVGRWTPGPATPERSNGSSISRRLRRIRGNRWSSAGSPERSSLSATAASMSFHCDLERVSPLSTGLQPLPFHALHEHTSGARHPRHEQPLPAEQHLQASTDADDIVTDTRAKSGEVACRDRDLFARLEVTLDKVARAVDEHQPLAGEFLQQEARPPEERSAKSAGHGDVDLHVPDRSQERARRAGHRAPRQVPDGNFSGLVRRERDLGARTLTGDVREGEAFA